MVNAVSVCAQVQWAGWSVVQGELCEWTESENECSRAATTIECRRRWPEDHVKDMRGDNNLCNYLPPTSAAESVNRLVMATDPPPPTKQP